MRGAYSLGALAALEDEGLTGAFDLVLGASSGAINGAYFLAGQARQGIDVYTRDLSMGSFLNPARVHRPVDIDFLVDDVLKRRHPLDTAALRASPALLKVFLTCAYTAEAVVLTNRDTHVDFYEVLRATAALPMLYNRRVKIGDRHFVDGGVAEPLPVLPAISAGADAVLTIATRRPGHRWPDASMPVRTFGRLLARGHAPTVKRTIGRANQAFNDTMDILEGVRPSPRPVRLRTVWPSDPLVLPRVTTRDPAQLQAAADMGRSDMRAMLGLPLVSR